MTSIVEAVRGNVVESRHRVSVAVARADGVLVARSGDPDLITFWRSAAKPFQALPLVADGVADALGLADDELALACASHNGEPEHVAVARRLLARSGSTERDLACGPHPSLAEEVARAMAERGEQPTRLHSNCSGKHAGMLALASHHRWDRAGYALPEHAVQLRCVAEVAVWTGVPAAAIALATDGCGVPSFALPLRAMALAYARLAAAATADPPGPGSRDGRGAAGRILSAMRAHPFMLAGTGRLDTDVALASGGTILAKVGAEGVYCAALLGPGIGVALKIEDGDGRSVAPALLAVLDVLVPGAVKGGEAFRSPALRNSVGDVVGRIVPRVRLERVRS